MYNKNIIIAVVFILFWSHLYPQHPEDEEIVKGMTPPSPTAYELGKYGQVPVGYFTGTANVNIPLYTFKAGNLSVPISLSYVSNGIKVDQLETNVGLGWSLNCGGVITRIVKDLPDEDAYEYYPGDSINNDPYSPISMQYFIDATAPDADNEADIFMFNFNGHTGKFVYDNDRRIILIPEQSIKIIPYPKDEGTCFEIITSDGIKYYFSSIEWTTFHQILVGNKSGSSKQANPHRITAWYLTRIVHPTGDTINFHYSGTHYSYINSITQYYDKNGPFSGTCGSGSTTCSDINFLKTYNNNSLIFSRYITQITSNNPNYGQINFEYNQSHPEIDYYNLISNINIKNMHGEVIENYDFQYLSTSNKRLFLSDIIFKDTTKKYEFKYIDPELLCERNSMDQDYWGYYNHKNNSYLLPPINDYFFNGSPYTGDRNPDHTYAKKGLLKTITYPTGGTTTFDYEANSYWGKYINITEIPKDIHLEAFTTPNTNSNDVSDTTEEINFNHEAFLHPSVECNYGCDECDSCIGWPSDHNYAVVSVKNLTTGDMVPLKNGDYYVGTFFKVYSADPYFSDLKAYLEAGNTYEVHLTAGFFCTHANLNFDYKIGIIKTVEENIPTGGLRIKRITSTDSVTNNNTIKRYYYNKYNNRDESSGNNGTKGYYIKKKVNRKACDIPCDYIDCEYYELGSNSLTPLLNDGNNIIYYKYVTVSFGGDNFENGGETHEFIINPDVQGNIIVGGEYAQNGIAWSNIGWNHGLEKSVTYFKVDNGDQVLASSKTNYYKNDSRNYNESYSYFITKNYDLICTNELTHICTQEDIDYIKLDRKCTTHHSHSWGFKPYYGYWCAAPGSHNITDTIYHPCHIKQVGDTIHYNNGIENLTITQYKNLSFWHYIDTTITKTYDQNGINPVTQLSEFFYDNASHIQLTRTKTTGSKGNLIEEDYFYPGDFKEIENFKALIDSNIISKPVKKLSLVNSNIINGNINKYNNDGTIKEIYHYENTELIGKPPHDSTVITTIPDKFIKKAEVNYDENVKKIIEYLPVNNYKTAYIWGYNYTQPVAKIENKTYQQVVDALSCSVEELQTKSETDLINVFNQLRIDLPDAIITSYTYVPLVGLSTETDPTGKTTYYQYDNLNRLETIRDNDYKVIKHIDYHYKSNN